MSDLIETKEDILYLSCPGCLDPIPIKTKVGHGDGREYMPWDNIPLSVIEEHRDKNYTCPTCGMVSRAFQIMAKLQTLPFWERNQKVIMP